MTNQTGLRFGCRLEGDDAQCGHYSNTDAENKGDMATREHSSGVSASDAPGWGWNQVSWGLYQKWGDNSKGSASDALGWGSGKREKDKHEG